MEVIEKLTILTGHKSLEFFKKQIKTKQKTSWLDKTFALTLI